MFVRGDRALYLEVSRRIMAIVAQGVDAFEEASIDEAYVDLSSLDDLERAQRHARTLKQTMLEREGLTCSVGIGPNKLVAKIASDFRKPDGLTVVRPDAWRASWMSCRSGFSRASGRRRRHSSASRASSSSPSSGRRLPSSGSGSARGARISTGKRGGSRTIRCPRVGAQVGGRAGDVRGGHARPGLRPRAGARAGRDGVPALRRRALHRLPHRDRHGALLRLPDREPVADGEDAVHERGGPARRGPPAARALLRRPREPEGQEDPAHRGAGGKALATR